MSDTRMGAAPAASVEEDPNATVACSSPPCFMHELDPTYLGYLSREEVSALLGELLAAEWGGAAPDEAPLRAALRRHLEALGKRLGPSSCPSHGAVAPSGPAAAAEPSDRGPDRLAGMIQAALPRVHEDALRRDLGEVLGALGRGGTNRDRP